jgi:hypothetical protein
MAESSPSTTITPSLTCFDNYIGIPGTIDNPTSGLSINDLQGVNFARADGVANTDYATGVEMLQDLIALAIRHVQDDMRTYMMPFFKFHGAIDHHLTAKYESGYHAASAADRGLKIEKKASTLSKIYVNRVRVLANSTGLYQIEITDGNDSTLYPVDLVAGEEQEVTIDYLSNRDIIYITIDNTSLEPAKGKVKNGGCGSCGKKYQYFTVWGWDGTKTSSYHYGIRADISVVCSEDAMACALKKQLGLPILYKFGILFMREAQHTDRVNFFTMVGREEAIDLEEIFKEEYKERIMTACRSFPRFLRTIDGYCVSCNQNKYIEVT